MVGISRRHLLGQATTSGRHSALVRTCRRRRNRPIRILVGFAAGGGNDVIARLVAQKMSEGASGQVLVDNKTGASGLIAADILAKAPPDGTTLMVATQTTYAVAPQLYKSVAFDAPRDVAGVCLLGASPLVLVVNPSFAAKSVGELIEMAKAKPGAINYGSGGVGTTPHTAAELFFFNSGVRMTHVAYRGEAPAIADVVAGQLPLLVRQRLGGDRPGEGGHAAGARRDVAQARRRACPTCRRSPSWASRAPTSRPGSASPPLPRRRARSCSG